MSNGLASGSLWLLTDDQTDELRDGHDDPIGREVFVCHACSGLAVQVSPDVNEFEYFSKREPT